MGSKRSEDLHTAARNGDLGAVVSILSSNPLAVNSRDNHSRTPLHLAAWAGHAHIITYLCKNKADVGTAAMDDMAAIHFASQKGHLEVMKALVSAGASVKAFNRKGFTSLHYASQGSHLDLAKYLIRKGANPNAKTKAGKTPIDLASNREMKQLLLESEKKPNKEGKGGDKSCQEKAVKDEEQGKVITAADESGEHEEENTKRKTRDEDDGEVSERSLEPKKSKVSLSHLLVSDDTEEVEE